MFFNNIYIGLGGLMLKSVCTLPETSTSAGLSKSIRDFGVQIRSFVTFFTGFFKDTFPVVVLDGETLGTGTGTETGTGTGTGTETGTAASTPEISFTSSTTFPANFLSELPSADRSLADVANVRAELNKDSRL